MAKLEEGKVFMWLDDLRDPKEFGAPEALWVKDPWSAMELLRSGQVGKISFDHDLGAFDASGKEVSGAEVASCVEELAFEGKLDALPEWAVHSANPKGRERIEAAMRSAGRFVAPSPKGRGPG